MSDLEVVLRWRPSPESHVHELRSMLAPIRISDVVAARAFAICEEVGVDVVALIDGTLFLVAHPDAPEAVA